MAYCWFPTRKNTTASLFYLHLRPLDSKLAYSPSLLSYSVVYYSHCPVTVQMLTGTKNIEHLKKQGFYFKTSYFLWSRKKQIENVFGELVCNKAKTTEL